jgi:hypothetical protein
VGVPPGSSKTLFAATVEALGVLTLLLLWVNKKQVKLLSVQRVTRLSIVAIVIFLISLFSYLFLYGYLVVEVEHSEALFFPLWTEGELKQQLATVSDRSELIREWGRDDVYKVIRSSSRVPLLLTTLLFLFLYQLVFVSLTFSFGLVGVKYK